MTCLRFVRMTIPAFVAGVAAFVAAATLAVPGFAQNGRDVGVFRRGEASPASAARKLAVVVGIDDYENLPDLTCAERDAGDMAAELETLGFVVARMRMAGPAGEPKPYTGGAILNQVEKMCKLAEPDGVLLFYFSGHGFEGPDGHNYLCPYGADRTRLSVTGLDLDEVQKRLVNSGVKQRLLVVDMCRNEAGKSGAGEERAFTLRQFEKAQGTGLLFSTAPGSKSFEPVSGMRDDAGGEIKNGLFTHYLLRGLRGEADRGRRAVRDGLVSFREVAYFVSDGLALLAMRRSDLEQTPYLKWDGTAEDVLLRVLPEPVVTPVAEAPPERPAVVPTPTPTPAKPAADVGGRDVSAWGEVLAKSPDPSVVTDAAARQKITASGWPWRVRDKQSGVVLVLVPAGEFMMGSPTGEEHRGREELQHRRVIRQEFYLGETEVTQAQWQRVMGSNPSQFPGSDNPVENVSWDDLQPFLQKTGLRLPSEAEWEYACRAGTTTPFSFGATLATSQANYIGDFIYGPGRKGEYRGKTIAVGALAKNAWGLCDMHGNVKEWCQDLFADYPARGGDERASESSGALRVPRGGSWDSHPGDCRAARRYAEEPTYHSSYVGFRAARTP